MNAVLFGGNGYIGRNVTEKWLKKDPNITFYVLSRSGKNELSDSRIKNIKVDVTDIDKVRNELPDEIEYIVDFVGGLDDNVEKLEKINIEPARVMLEIAEEKQVPVIAYVGGVLGSKDFTQTKQKAIKMLESSKSRLVVIEPTLVYGNGRSDSLTK